MLSATERRRIDICIAYKTETPRPTQVSLAQRFGVAPVTVNKAIHWGEQFGLFTDDISMRLQYQLAEWRDHLKFLESELRLTKRISRSESGKRYPISHNALKTLSSEIREVRTRIDELEGIYKQTVNVNVAGHDGGPLPTAITVTLVKPDAGTDS